MAEEIPTDVFTLGHQMWPQRQIPDGCVLREALGTKPRGHAPRAEHNTTSGVRKHADEGQLLTKSFTPKCESHTTIRENTDIRLFPRKRFTPRAKIISGLEETRRGG